MDDESHTSGLAYDAYEEEGGLYYQLSGTWRFGHVYRNG